MRKNIHKFLESMEGVLADTASTLGEFRVQKVSITVEVSATGKVSLLGSGAELAGKGGLTFELVREPLRADK